MNEQNMLTVVEMFELLDDRHIVVTCATDGSGWYFSDTDLNDGGDDNFYETSELAAESAIRFYSLDVTIDDDEVDPFNSDAEADADALASAGWGTDEDYGCFSSGDDY